MSDLVEVIERCYSLEGGRDEWLRGVMEAAVPLTPFAAQLAGMVFEVRDGIAEIAQIRTFALDDFGGAEGVREFTRPKDPAQSRRLFTAGPVVAFASKVEGHPAFANEVYASALARSGVTDLVGVRAISEPGRGVVLSFPLGLGRSLGVREVATWQRIAAHVGTGLRLLDRMQPEAPEPEAILSPSGKVEHAEADAKSNAAREDLARATRAIDRARGTLRRVDPQEALALWRCLVDGTWTLVDTFESDGRRYVVAHRNERPAFLSGSALGAELTDRELDVLARLADGHGNKLIAYELGLSLSTVATLLKRAAAKLGANSRAELVYLARTRGTRRRQGSSSK